MKVGDGNREGPGRKVQQETYRRWPARAQVRMKWWGKSPPRRGQPERHGKPHAVQDRTGEGLPVRHKPRVIVALRASGAPRSGGVREMAVQLRASGVDRIRLTGGRHPYAPKASRRRSRIHGPCGFRTDCSPSSFGCPAPSQPPTRSSRRQILMRWSLMTALGSIRQVVADILSSLRGLQPIFRSGKNQVPSSSWRMPSGSMTMGLPITPHGPRR